MHKPLSPLLRAAILPIVSGDVQRLKQDGAGAKRAKGRVDEKRTREAARGLPTLPETRQMRRQAKRTADKCRLADLKNRARTEGRKGGSAPIKRLEDAS